jgi:hypothetical protein
MRCVSGVGYIAAWQSADGMRFFAHVHSGRREALGTFPGEKNFNRFPAWLVRAQLRVCL